MPLPEPEAGSPRDWLRHAQSDLGLCLIERPRGVLAEALCFHAQQAAEKAIKAVLVSGGVRVPRTHNIRALVRALPEAISPPEEASDWAVLTDYAVAARYPTDTESVTEDELLRAVSMAQRVVAWAASQIA